MDELNRENKLSISRKELYENVRTGDAISKQALLDYVVNKFNLQNCSQIMLDEIKSTINSFVIVLSRNWKKCRRTKHVFEKKYSEWLKTSIEIRNIDVTGGSASGSASTSAGRPKKSFRFSSTKSKTRKIKPLLIERSLSELTHATAVKLRTSGRRDAASMLKELASSPGRATKFKKAVKKSENIAAHYTPEEALSIMNTTKLSFRKYNFIRKTALMKGSRLFPSYELIKQAKQLCYPDKKACNINESLMEIELQSLVNLTVVRLCNAQADVLRNIFESNEAIDDITMIYKWGCDGSGSHSRYKQKAETEDFDDSHLLVTSMVPLQLYGLNKNNKIILWQNPKPCSTSFCRPIRLRYVKETEDVITKEFKNIREQISVIQTTKINVGDYYFEINHKFEETMIDGKVCNILAHNKSSQRCYICNATSKDMNKLESIRERDSKPETFSWGLSTLHAKIRVMECILHIGYRMDVKKWQCRNSDDKLLVEQRKKSIIDSFRKRTGLLLDTPKQGGGNTNDGNSARRFLKNAMVAADITGVDEELIHRFYVVTSALNSDHEIDIPLLKTYCDETVNLYVSLYPWYPMPITVHKILLHSAEVIKSFLLPIGQMSEEAQEARHKDIRRIRLDGSRKTSRIASNTDILHALLISSDPQISSLFDFQQRKSSPLHPDVLKLLKGPNLTKEESEIENEDSDSEEDEDEEDYSS